MLDANLEFSPAVLEAAAACLAAAYGAAPPEPARPVTEQCLRRAYEAAAARCPPGGAARPELPPDPLFRRASSYEVAVDPLFRERFEVERVVGSGTFSVVDAVRTPAGRRFARKTVDLEGRAEEEQRKLSAEGLILRRLEHPFIVRCFAVDNTPKRSQCLLELAEMNLATWLEARRPDVDWTLRLLAQLAQALRFLERACVLHRDLKPANVLLFSAGAVAKLGDFGSSRLLLGSSGFASATPYYMAPESLQAREYSEATDRWALGCIVYEVASGARPFEASNGLALARKVADGEYEPLPPAAAPLAPVVAGLLQLEPAERWTLDAVLATPGVRPFVVAEPAAPLPVQPLPDVPWRPYLARETSESTSQSDSWERAEGTCGTLEGSIEAGSVLRADSWERAEGTCGTLEGSIEAGSVLRADSWERAEGTCCTLEGSIEGALAASIEGTLAASIEGTLADGPSTPTATGPGDAAQPSAPYRVVVSPAPPVESPAGVKARSPSLPAVSRLLGVTTKRGVTFTGSINEDKIHIDRRARSVSPAVGQRGGTPDANADDAYLFALDKAPVTISRDSTRSMTG